MELTYGFKVDKQIVLSRLEVITNQIFKLLPYREEGGDWLPLLENLIIELIGFDVLLEKGGVCFFSMICKLIGLTKLTKEEDFLYFRKTIFECLSICSKIKNIILEMEEE